MPALEKYKPGEDTDRSRQKQQPEDFNLSVKGGVDLQKQLTEFKVDKRREYARKRRRIIAEALKQAKDEGDDQPNDFSGRASEKLGRRHHRERLKNYRESLKNEEDLSARAFAFTEITDFQFNQEIFHAEGGWLDEFQKTEAHENGGLEEFVLQKQYAELTTIRETLLESRVADKIVEIYPDLEGEDKEEDRKAKAGEVTKGAKDFFQANSAEIEKCLLAEPADKIDLRKVLYEKFKSGVFADVNLEDSEIEIKINILFIDLLDDYESMMTARAKARLLNPKMVQLLLRADMTEADWERELAKEAEKQSKRLKEKAKALEQEQAVGSGQLADIDIGPMFYTGEISVDETMGTNAPVTFELVGPGKYLVRFPTDGTNGPTEALFTVRTVREGDKSVNVFIFNDPLMDKPAIVRDSSFRAQINGLYLEKVMSSNVKSGKDYLGPGLNDIIHDQEMFSIAEDFFAPKKLNDYPLTKSEADSFRKMMMLLASPGNNKPSEGIYGDLLAIRNRISLLKFAIESPARASLFRQYFEKADFEAIKKLSVETVCKRLGIAANYGNFTKS